MLILFLLSVLAVGDKPEPTMVWNALFDAGHVPLFGAIALATRKLLRSWRPGANRPARAITAFLITLAIGVVSELLQQGNPYRDASLNDVLRDAAGAAAFLLLAEVRGGGNSALGSRRRAVRVTAIVSAVGLLAGATAQLAVTAIVLVERARSLPVLARLDGTWWEGRIINTGYNTLTPRAHAALSASETSGLARLDLLPGTYSGVTIDEPYPDWRRYSRLVITVASNLDVTILLSIRVHDAGHSNRYADWFNSQAEIRPGLHRLVFDLNAIRDAPDGREMDMSRIRGIVLYVHRLREPISLHLGPIELE